MACDYSASRQDSALRVILLFFTAMAIPYIKPHLSYVAQLELLKSRRMQFADETKALHLLEKIGYYRLSGYWYPLLADKGNHIFKTNASFETAFNLYKFDRELRKIITAEIEKIEIAIRAKISHELSMAYNPFWIEDFSLFSSAQNHRETLNKVREEYARSTADFATAFKNKYSNPLPPSFMLLEVVSFGVLLRLYNNLLSSKAKKDIAETFGLSDTVFVSWLHSVVSIRNVCAHHERLWNKKLRIQPLFPRKPRQVWLTNNSVNNNRLFYALSIILYLLNTVNPKHSFKQKLCDLFAKYPNVDKAAMGFPADWENEPLWKT